MKDSRSLLRRDNMHKRVFSFLILVLLLTHTLSVAYIASPALAENHIAAGKSVDKRVEPALSSGISEKSATQQKNQEGSKELSNDGGDVWSYAGLSQISNFTYIDGNKTRLVVGLDSEKKADVSALEKRAALYQAKIVNTVSMGGKLRAIVFELSLASVEGFVDEMHISGLASYVEPNMKVQAQFLPDDPYWSMQWGPQKIGADWAWNTTVGDHSTLVAVVDTGIFYSHEDIAPNYVALGFDWVNNDTDPVDDYGHGTHCAGIIAAASNNSAGIAGLAQVGVMAEKVLDAYGWGYEDWVAQGIVHATDCGAKIISMSIGGWGDSELIHEAIKYAYDAGVLVIAAAGNDNSNVKPYPAGYDEVIAVAATDQNDQKASFSNWGDWIELSAPGVDIYSTVPWGYEPWSGTSMACPHVAGVAALVWSEYPNRTRDWVRSWLRYSADDLGDVGFDSYYGYGRVNARKAVELEPPAHELIAYGLATPSYVEPGTSATLDATILNFGVEDEHSVTVELLANDTTISSSVIGSLPGGGSAKVSFIWNPAVEGEYNITLYVVPVSDETYLENNALSKYVYVGFPVRAVVLHSAGNIISEIVANWQALNGEWYLFGDTMVSIDYSTLNKDSITYEDIVASRADVLIISCASDPYSGWQFTDSEVEAIERYVYEGHGLIATSGTFYWQVPNNNKLAPLFGLSETMTGYATQTDLLHVLNASHPIFKNVPNPLVFQQVATVIPSDGQWDSNELVGGNYLALGHSQESAVVSFRGLVYISPLLEMVPPYYHHHLQLFYNAILWSKYQKPQHELAVSLDVPSRLTPGESTVLNATVSNRGLSNETNVELRLFIGSTLETNLTIPQLLAGSSYTLSYSWTPNVQGAYNITAYAPPITGEDFAMNNIAGKTVIVLLIAVRNVLVYSDDAYVAPSSRYVILALNELGINYTYYVDDPWGFGSALVSQSWDLVVVDHCNYYAMGDYWTELDYYVRNGGLLVLSTFDIDGSNSEPTSLWDTLGVRWVSDMGSPEPVYRWVPSHAIFNFPNSIGDLTSYSYGYSDGGDHVAATTGTAIAGFTNTPVEDSAGIVVGNAYQTVLFSFRLDEFRYDQDGDGKLDAIELWQNAIVYLARGFEHDLAVSLVAPTFLEPSDSVKLNATVRNRGLNNETNITLELTINGTMVNSELIPELLTGASHTIDYLWTPVEGTYNITAYAPPLSTEEFPANNIATKNVSVRPIKHVLFEQTHGTDNVYDYNKWVTSLVEKGYVVETSNVAPITPDTLAKYDVFIIPQAYAPYTADELATIQDFVFGGGGLLVIGDDNPYIYSDLTGFAGITWTGGGMSGTTTDITSHPVTVGVSSVYLYAPVAMMYITGDAHDLVRDPVGEIMLAVSEVSSGKVLGFADEDSLRDYSISQEDNLRLANNMIDWLSIAIPVEHDLSVSLEAPAFLNNGTSTLLNATVRNRGLNNETNVELQLLINSTQVNSVVIPELSVGAFYTINYNLSSLSWLGKYNVTAYATPVPGENVTSNNVVTKVLMVPYYARTYTSPQWVGGGTPMEWHADDNSWEYTLPFSFPFYGVFYDEIYVSSNGLITFNWPDYDCNNGIPALASKLAIAPAWDDWTSYYPCDIYIWQNSTHIGIRWYVQSLSTGAVANFEVILGEVDGVIQFDYGYSSGPVSATLGISNGNDEVLAEDVTQLDYANTIVFTPPPPPPADVAVTGLSVSPTDVYQGWIVNASVTVVNLGRLPYYVIVSLYYDDNLAATEYVFLQPNETLNLNFQWVTIFVTASHNYTIKAEASIVPGETNTANNEWVDGTVNVRIIGDANNDGKVDIFDCILASSAFGASSNEPEYQVFSDVNQDGIVDIYDMLRFAIHFGEGT
jgi:thermitase